MKLSRMPRYLRAMGVRGSLRLVTARALTRPTILEVRWPGVASPIYVRYPSSDLPTCGQVFLNDDYKFEVKRPPRVIVDAGANIGLASIYFANRFPDALIVAIEPEIGNLQMLRRNVAPYPNIAVMHAALWSENRAITLVDPGLGEWGFMTQPEDASNESFGETIDEVQGMTVDAIMREHGIDRIDILKIDVEGAEREVFQDPSAWINDVDALIVELHDRIKQGCSQSFYAGSRGFENEWIQGENVYLSRSASVLTGSLAKVGA